MVLVVCFWFCKSMVGFEISFLFQAWILDGIYLEEEGVILLFSSLHLALSLENMEWASAL